MQCSHAHHSCQLRALSKEFTPFLAVVHYHTIFGGVHYPSRVVGVSFACLAHWSVREVVARRLILVRIRE
jgi:hypothetical protein